MADKPTFRKPFRTTEDLFWLSQHDALVKSFIAAWQLGSFPSFEAMLIALVCELAQQRDNLSNELFKTMQEKKPCP